MLARVLIENTTRSDLIAEWGLAIYIEYGGKKFLLDTGATGKFVENAEALGIDLEEVDYGVLSHAHYDHSDGMEAFFAINRKAPFYLRESADGMYYGTNDKGREYAGIKREYFTWFSDRFIFAEGDHQITEGVYLIPHKSGDLRSVGEKAQMYEEKDGEWVPDAFTHEQSLVFDTESGLVIFNSCSHGGVDVILNEVAQTFPDKNISAMIGGFHLHATPEDEVRNLARKLKAIGIPRLITGHCTGDKAYEVLREELGERVEMMYTGMEIIF